MVWYTTIGSADAKMLVDEFRRRYPRIAAEYFRTGGPQLVERMFTEARAGKHLWDVFMNSAIYTHLLNEKGMLAVYESRRSHDFTAMDIKIRAARGHRFTPITRWRDTTRN